MMAPALMLGILLGRASGQLLPCLIALAASLAVPVFSQTRGRAAVLLVTVAAGSVLGQAAYHPTLPEEGTYRVTAVVADEVRQRENGQISTTLADVTLEGKRLLTKAYWSFYADELPEGLVPGAAVSMTVSLYHPDGAANPGGFDWREYLLQQGVTVGLYGQEELTCRPGAVSLSGWIARLRHTLCQGLYRVMGEEAGSYASAMLLGVRSGVSDEDRDSFNALGVGHLLSVSGFHVGILYAALAFLLKKLRLPARRRFWPTALLLLLYCALTGGHAPVIRASVLCLLNEYGRLRGRQRSRVHLIAGSAVLQLVISPVQLTGAGFQLSYGALLGICLVTPWLERGLERLPRRRLTPERLKGLKKKLCGGFAMALGAQLGVLLPELYWYQELPVLGILCNMLLLTLASGLLTVYWACLALMWVPGLGPLLGQAAAALTSLLLQGVRAFGSADWLLLWTKQANLLTAAGWLLLLLGCCGLCHWRWSSRAASALLGLLLTVLSVIPFPETETSYIQLSVGEADAAVLLDGGQVTVIDTGEDSTLATWLHQRRLGVDSLILTHLHSDHAGGVEELLKEGIPVKTCYLSASAGEGDVAESMIALVDRLEQSGTRIVRVGRGDVLPLPSGKLTVLWPEAETHRPWTDANDASLTLLAEVRGVTMLLTGDLCGDFEMYAAVRADILKAAHHGSSGSTSQAFLEAVDPQTVLLSCGRASRENGFRERLTVGTLYSTWSRGAVTVRFTGEGRYSVSTWLKQE